MELEQKQVVETVENKNEIEINEDFSDNDTQTQQQEQKEQSTEEIPKKQDKKTNAEYAQKRREQERL